jgi:Tat protein translocase TatB subunit
MFGIGTWEFMLVLIVGLMVLGPSKLPSIAKSLGRGYNEFKRASQELRDSLTESIEIDEIKESIDEAKHSFEDMVKIPDGDDIKKKIGISGDDFDLSKPVEPLDRAGSEPESDSLDVAEYDQGQDSKDPSDKGVNQGSTSDLSETSKEGSGEDTPDNG